MTKRNSNFFKTTPLYNLYCGRRGVYKLKNLINGKFYIGSTNQSFTKRASEHLFTAYVRVDSTLSKKTSHRPIYKAIRKYGSENFQIDILWETTEKNRDLILEKEQEFLDLYFNDPLCYNLSEKADKPSRMQIPGGYTIITPSGESIKVDILKDYCQENNLSEQCMAMVARGEISKHKNYYCYFNDPERFIPQKQTKDFLYILYNPEGQRFETENLLEFCREHFPGCNSETIRDGLIRAYQNQSFYKDWQVYKKDNDPGIAKPHPVVFVLFNPDKEKFEVNNLSEFCREYNLSEADRINLINCAQGKRHQVKGWTCFYVENAPETWVDPATLAGYKEYILYNPSNKEKHLIKNLTTDCKALGLSPTSVFKAADSNYAGKTVKGFYCYEKADFPGEKYIDTLPENLTWEVSVGRETVYTGTRKTCAEYLSKIYNLKKSEISRAFTRNKTNSFKYLQFSLKSCIL